MTITRDDLRANPDFDKLVTVEIELARKLEEQDWTPTGGGSYWIPFNDGEVHIVKIDNEGLLEMPGIGECDGTPNSFFYDILNKNLFIHPTDGDSPDTMISSGIYKYCVIAYFFIGIANKLVNLQRYDELLIDGGFDWWTSMNDLEFWTKVIVGTAALIRGSIVYDNFSAYSANLYVSAEDSSVLIYQDSTCRMGGKTMIRFKYIAGDGLKLRFYDTGENLYLKEDGTWNIGLYTIAIPPAIVWTEYQIIFNAHAGYQIFRLAFLNDIDENSVYIDNAELKRYREEMPFLPYLNENSLPSISQSIGSYHQQEEQIAFGSIKFIDDGYFAARYADTSYLWNNKNLYLKLGFVDSTYDDLVFLFWGQTRKPELTAGNFTIDVKDQRIEFRKIPVTIFSPTNHPNCEENWKNKPIPILFGEINWNQGFAPPQCDTIGYTYKVSQTVFGSKTYPIYSIDKVYKDGILLDPPPGGDYDVNLNEGIFTLHDPPGTSLITCEARGIIIDFHTWIYDFSYIPASILKFLLYDLNELPINRINLASIKKLYDGRKLICGYWLKEETDSSQFLKLLKDTGAFHFFMMGNGEYFARILESAIPADAPHFLNVHINNFSAYQNIDQCYKKIIIRLKQNQQTGDWVETPAESDRAEWEHDVKRSFTFDTMLQAVFQANDLRDNYLSMLDFPFWVVSGTFPTETLLLNPTDKFYLTYIEKDADGNEITVFDNIAFIITDITKDINSAKAQITAIQNIPELFWTIT